MAQQIKKKFIGSDQVDGSKILLEVGQTIRQKDGLGGEVDVIQSLEDSISAEQSRAEAAESALDGRLTTAEGEIDQLQVDVTSNLSAAQAYTDQKIADLVDSAPALLDTLNELSAALGDDPNFVTTVTNLVAGVQSNLDQEILDRTADVNAEESRAMGVESSLQSQISQEILDRIADVDAEESARIAADGVLQSDINTRIPSAEKGAAFGVADLDENAQVRDYQIKSVGAYKTTYTPFNASHWYTGFEPDNASSALDQLAQKIDGLTAFEIDFTAIDSADWYTGFTPTRVDEALNQLAQRLTDITAYDVAFTPYDSSKWISGFVPTTTSHALDQLAQLVSDGSSQAGNIQSELDATQVGAGLESSGSYVAPVGSNYLGSAVSLKDADSKLDTQIKVVADGLSQEISDRIAAVSAEQSRAEAAEAALDGRLDVLESVVWIKEKFSISNGQTSVTLSHTPEAGSMSAFVDRLAIHEGSSEDYTISGTTMTFLNDLVSPGQSQLGNGDTVYVKYQYKV